MRLQYLSEAWSSETTVLGGTAPYWEPGWCHSRGREAARAWAICTRGCRRLRSMHLADGRNLSLHDSEKQQ